MISVLIFLIACEQEEIGYPQKPMLAELPIEAINQQENQEKSNQNDLQLQAFRSYLLQYMKQHLLSTEEMDQGVIDLKGDQMINHDAQINDKPSQIIEGQGERLKQFDFSDHQVNYDFCQSLNQAYIESNQTFMLGPELPGWTNSIQQDRDKWGASTLSHQHFVSWIQGVNATLNFAMNSEIKAPQELWVWIESIAQQQKLSIFLDKQPLMNINLKNKAQFYKIPLNQSLQPGEHQLRFWFRFAKNIKSTAAIGPIYIGHQNQAIALPSKWSNDQKDELYAGPPYQYHYYLMVPEQGVLSFSPKVKSQKRILFEVSIESDQQKQKLFSETIEDYFKERIDISLKAFQKQFVKISFKTSTPLSLDQQQQSDFEIAKWGQPIIWSPSKKSYIHQSVKHLILWQIEGLRNDLFLSALYHPDFYFPNLQKLIKKSLFAYDAWQTPLLATWDTTFFEQLKKQKISTMFLTRDELKSDFISDLFDHIDIPKNQNPYKIKDEERGIESTSLRPNLMGLNATSIKTDKQINLLKKYQKQKYDHLDEFDQIQEHISQNPSSFTHLYTQSFKLLTHPNLQKEMIQKLQFSGQDLILDSQHKGYYFEKQMIHYLSALKNLDYQVGLLMANLQYHQQLEDTAIILVGTGSFVLKDIKNTHPPIDQLMSPLLIFHPKLDLKKEIFIKGSSLSQLPNTILKLFTANQDLQSMSLFDPLVGDYQNQSVLEMPPTLQKSQINHTTYERLGHILIKEQGNESLAYDLKEDPFALKIMDRNSSITMRTMKNLMNHPLQK